MTGGAVPEYARLFVEGLKEADVSIVTALPESLLASVYRLCASDNAIRYIQVSNEADMPGICAGTYLAGKRALMIMENSGIRQCCEPVARLAFQHAVPMVMAMSYRGEWGEQNWWGHNHAQTMEPILDALRIPHRFVTELGRDQTGDQALLQARRRQQLAGRAGLLGQLRGATGLCKGLTPSARSRRPSRPRTW